MEFIAKVSAGLSTAHTVCMCTWGPTTVEAPPPGKREDCHAKVCHFVVSG